MHRERMYINREYNGDQAQFKDEAEMAVRNRYAMCIVLALYCSNYQHVTVPASVCRHYLRGRCWYGSQCRFEHPLQLMPLIRAGVFESLFTREDNEQQARMRPMAPPPRAPNVQLLVPVSVHNKSRVRPRQDEYQNNNNNYGMHNNTKPIPTSNARVM